MAPLRGVVTVNRPASGALSVIWACFSVVQGPLTEGALSRTNDVAVPESTPKTIVTVVGVTERLLAKETDGGFAFTVTSFVGPYGKVRAPAMAWKSRK